MKFLTGYLYILIHEIFLVSYLTTFAGLPSASNSRSQSALAVLIDRNRQSRFAPPNPGKCAEHSSPLQLSTNHLSERFAATPASSTNAGNRNGWFWNLAFLKAGGRNGRFWQPSHCLVESKNRGRPNFSRRYCEFILGPGILYAGLGRSRIPSRERMNRTALPRIFKSVVA
jgi:hypothetical protein